ncbi:substrate-binding periplasmic protein [Pseudomonas citri]|uniref:substrate-binding periplasmic protein n=1 Tax=Pseudomonas citri TaxID=2978349 RepID=UPI0021B52198|nr:transporter substrate-binding domain-containing protein [Pseudomonas citri]
MQTPSFTQRPASRSSSLLKFLVVVAISLNLLGLCAQADDGKTTLRYFPSGPIYEYRWQLLELALAHTRASDGPVRLVPYTEEVSQNRGMELLQAGQINVIALGTNAERESHMLPIKIDILRGLVGFRLLVIRAADQARIAQMDEQALRKQLTFGLNSQWADVPIMQAGGFTVVTATNYENLFGMLAGERFDAFPRGLNEAARELEERKDSYPQLVVEKSKALFFPYPVYFWVNKNDTALAQRIERGLNLSLADGSFRKLFETYHANEIAALAKEHRQVIRLPNPVLPEKTPEPDTHWWWK